MSSLITRTGIGCLASLAILTGFARATADLKAKVTRASLCVEGMGVKVYRVGDRIEAGPGQVLKLEIYGPKDGNLVLSSESVAMLIDHGVSVKTGLVRLQFSAENGPKQTFLIKTEVAELSVTGTCVWVRVEANGDTYLAVERTKGATIKRVGEQRSHEFPEDHEMVVPPIGRGLPSPVKLTSDGLQKLFDDLKPDSLLACSPPSLVPDQVALIHEPEGEVAAPVRERRLAETTERSGGSDEQSRNGRTNNVALLAPLAATKK